MKTESMSFITYDKTIMIRIDQTILQIVHHGCVVNTNRPEELLVNFGFFQKRGSILIITFAMPF